MEHNLPKLENIPKRDRLVDYEIIELATLLRERAITSVEITEAYLARINDLNGPFGEYDSNGYYNAFVRIDAEAALAQARQADLRIEQGGTGIPLICGIPIGIKEPIAIQGRRSTNGSDSYDGNIASHDAAVVAQLRLQGAVFLGHTITSFRSQDVVGTFAANAWDPARTPGGSSQGSAVAPVARLAAATLGVETGGSIIIPAACNGASAIKPSRDLVSVVGVMPQAPGFDVVGPMARSVCDASLLLNAISQLDGADNPSAEPNSTPNPLFPMRFSIVPKSDKEPLKSLRIGIPQTDWMGNGELLSTPPAETYDRSHAEAFERFKTELILLGAEVIEFTGLDLNNSDNNPFYSMYAPAPLAELLDGRQLSQFDVIAKNNSFCMGHWHNIIEFMNSDKCTEEQRAKLDREYAPEFMMQYLNNEFITPTHRSTAEQLLLKLQSNYQKALDTAEIDFMVALPLGSVIPRRFEEHGGNFRSARLYKDFPNMMGWPMVTFPIGISQPIGIDTRPLPINAAFWGPRFSEPLLIQAAIDFQSYYPKYHGAIPPEPVFPCCQRPPNIPRVRPVTPETSTVPLSFYPPN